MMMKRVTGLPLWPALAAALSVMPTTYAATSVWELTTSEHFAAAKELKGLSLHRLGWLHLAPKQIPVKGVDELLVVCLAADNKGNVYAGTGAHGRILKVAPQYRAAVLWQVAEQLVTSLAVDAHGSVYAAAAATGKIYKLAFPKGTTDPRVSVFCQLSHKYLWGMTFDKAGSLLVAASLPEALYSIAPNGKATKLVALGQGHLHALVVGPSGNIFTASEPEGIVYKVTPKRQVQVLYDAEEAGIRCLLLDKQSNLYVGAAGGYPGARARLKPSRAPDPAGRPSSSSKTSVSVKTVTLKRAAPRASQAKGAPGRANSVYRISPDGRVKKVFSPGKAYILALALDGQGRLLVATGNEGKVFRIEESEEVTDLIDRTEAQVMALLPWKNSEFLMGTGNKGRLIRVTPAPSPEGAFQSSILDASFVSKWGRVWWDADVPPGASLTVATRSGNSAKPDKTWSAYSAELTRASGSAITSPPARYLQLRATFKAPKTAQSPVLRRVRVAYLPDNQAPKVESVTVSRNSPAPKSSKAKRSQPSPPASSPAAAKIQWKASDSNGDTLRYAVYYKGAGEKAWKTLKDKIEGETSLAWDTDRVPDGQYVIKVVASDAPSNPPGVALTGERVSLPARVDNTRPQIAGLSIKLEPKGKCTVTGTARDAQTYVAKLEYSLDAGDWVSFFPRDRILDAPAEPFSFTLDKLAPGEHTIVVVAKDARGNAGSAKVVAVVK